MLLLFYYFFKYPVRRPPSASSLYRVPFPKSDINYFINYFIFILLLFYYFFKYPVRRPPSAYALYRVPPEGVRLKESWLYSSAVTELTCDHMEKYVSNHLVVTINDPNEERCQLTPNVRKLFTILAWLFLTRSNYQIFPNKSGDSPELMTALQ